jgi:hypothetical protein
MRNRGSRPSLKACIRLPRQTGQALVEFTIAAMTLLVPLFFMISYIAKYHDMQAATIQAARYAAWERTVYFGESDWASGTAQKSESTIQAEIRSRFFSGPGNGFQSGAANPLWVDHAGAPILGTWTTDQSSKGQTPGTGDFVLGKVTEVISVIGKVLGADGFKLDMNTLYTAEVSVAPAQSGAIARMFAGGAGSFRLAPLTEKNMVVANGWSANGPDFVKKQTESLALTSVFSRSPLQEALWAIQSVGGTFIEELKPESLKLGGDIQVDRVPGDRLSGGNAPAPTKTKVPASDRMNQEQGAQEGAANQNKDRFRNTMVNFENESNAIQNKINSCQVSKQDEMWGNYYGQAQGERWTNNGCSRREKYCSIDAGLLGCWRHDWRTVYFSCNRPYNYEYIKEKPGSSWTPNFDADYSCHGGLDARINQLQINYNNEQLIKDARAGCAGSTTPDCTEMNNKLNELDAKISRQKSDRNALDAPFSSCSCQPGDGTSCTTARSTSIGKLINTCQ